MKRIPIFISSLAIFRTLKIHFRSIQFPSILIIQLPLFAARRSAYFCSVLPQSQALFMLSFSSVAVVQSLGRSSRRGEESGGVWRRVESSRRFAIAVVCWRRFQRACSSAIVCVCNCVCISHSPCACACVLVWVAYLYLLLWLWLRLFAVAIPTKRSERTSQMSTLLLLLLPLLLLLFVYFQLGMASCAALEVEDCCC